MKKIFAAFLFIFFAGSAYSQQLSFGILEEVTYDDNIYMTPNDKQSSLVNAISAFGDYKTQIPDTRLKVLIDGSIGYQLYTRDESKNDFPFATLNAEINNDYLTFGNRFIYTSEQATLAQEERAERMQNVVFLAGKTSTEKLIGVGFFIDDIYDNYFTNSYDYLDRNRLDVGGRVYLNLTSKTALYAEYKFSTIAYQQDTNSNSDSSAVSAGIRGLIAPKVKALASISYDMRNYDKKINEVSNDEDLFEYNLIVEWEPTSQNMVRLTSSRVLDEIAYGNNRNVVDTLVSLMLSQKIYDKLNCMLTVSYENFDYSEIVGGIERNDDIVTIRPSVEYAFKERFSLGLWYQYRDRDSNNNVFDYKSSKTGLSAKFTF